MDLLDRESELGSLEALLDDPRFTLTAAQADRLGIFVIGLDSIP